MKKYTVLVFFLLTVALKPSLGQTDTEFWFAAPRITTGHGTGGIPIYIRLASANLASDITISVPANPAFTPIYINLPANTAHTQDVSAFRAFFENEPFDQVLNRGILIEATNLITAYYEVGTHLNPDIFSLKGRNALGNEFYVPFQNFFSNGSYTPQPYSSALIVATEDNTTVTITPTRPAFPGRPAGVPFTITLNRGQTFAVVPNEITAGAYPRTGQLAANRLTGTHIVSNKPIAVTTADDSVRANEANNWGCRDLIGDQIVPVSILGDEYIAMRGRLYKPPANSMFESFYVIATAPSTQIFVDGILRATINAGQSYRHEFSAQAHYINSSEPIYVYHVAGFGCEMGGGLLPPISVCTGSTQVSFTRSKGESFFLNILVRVGAEDGFILNGNGPNTLINQAIFNPVPGTDKWLAGEIELSPVATIPVGVASLISNTKDVFHLGIINGGPGSGTMYGYFSDFNILDVQSVIAGVGTDIELFCHGYPIQLLATGGTSYVWEPPDFLDDPFSPTPIALPDTTIRYTVTVSGACDMTDEASLTLVITDPVRAIFSTSQISGCSPLEISVFNHSIGVTNYSWRFGDGQSSSINMSEFAYTYINDTDVPQQYQLMLVGRNPYFCVDTMYTYITVNPEIRAEARANVISGCAPLDVDFESITTGASKYLWKFGDGGETTQENPTHRFHNYTNEEISYQVVLKASSDFGCVDYDTLYVNVKPYLKGGFAFSDPEYCSPINLEIHNTSVGFISSFSWDFDDGQATQDIPDSSFNYFFENTGDTPVTHYIELIVENVFGCADVIVKPVIILPNIKSDFSIDVAPVGCNPLEVDFTNLSEGATSYFWTFGLDQGGSMLENPNHIFINNDPDNVADFFVQLISTSDYGCKDTSDILIQVYPRTEADFSTDYAEYCAPQDVDFTNLSIGGTSFLWDFGDGTIVYSDDAVVNHTFNNQGNVAETFLVTLTVENDFGCKSVITRPIIIYPDITAAFITETSGCHPLEIDFLNNSIGASSYYWEFGDGGSSNIVNPNRIYYNPSHTDIAYATVRLFALSAFGCRDTTETLITIFPKPLAEFEADNSQGCAPLDVSFTDQTIGGLQLLWRFGDGVVINAGIGNQNHIYNNSTNNAILFNPELFVTNQYGCIDTLSYFINVFPEISAEFNLSVNEGCHPLEVTFSNLSSGASATNPFQWNYGDGSSSSETGNSHTHLFENPSHISIAEYQIKLNAKSSYGCVDSLTKSVRVFPKPKSLFDSPDDAICSPAVVSFTDQSIGGLFYTWNFGNGFQSGVSGSVTHTFNQPAGQGIGWFETSLYIVNQYGCNDTYSKQVKVYPLVTSSFAGNISGCHPLTVNFINNSTGGNTYQWSFGDNTFSNLFTPQKLFNNFSNTNSQQYNVTLTTTSEYGCVASYQRQVNVYPVPKSEFTITPNQACSPINVRINNLSVGGSNFNWNFGNGSSTNSSPVFYRVFRNQITEPKTFNVLLTVGNTNGCSSQYSQSVLVYPEVKAEFSTQSGVFAGCTPITLNFVNESVLANQFDWSFGDGVTSTLLNPTHMFITTDDVQTDYDVRLIATSRYGCKDTVDKVVEVYPKPIADFFVNPFEQFYPSTTVSLRNLSSLGNWNFKWELGDGFILNTTNRDEFDYTYQWTDGVYQTRYYNIRLQASNPYCNDIITKQIMIKAPHPVVGFSPSAQGCPPFEVQFVNQSLYGLYYYWDFGDGNTSNAVSPFHVFEEPGNFLVKLVVEGDGGLDSAYQTITVFYPPIADFRVDPDSVQLPYDFVRMINLSSLGATFEWHFGDGAISFDFEPIHYYPEAGVYDVTLIVGTDTYPQCFDTMTKLGAVVAAEPCNIYFPNAFIPDASGPQGGSYVIGDPSNKIFHPIQEGVEEYVLEIYNRWGELIFRTEDVNYGWDGYFRGKLVNTGVYVYKVWATCSNGNRIKKAGDVTVYR